MKQVPELPFEEFSSRIKFHAGGYDAPESYSALNEELAEYEAGKPGNRLFFLSVPPTVFGACSEMISSKVRAVEPAFTHLIIEKPFGRDTASFNELNDCTSSLFKESQLFRIDHYLGKEVVLNLVSLRFANQVYEPIWNKVCVRASGQNVSSSFLAPSALTYAPPLSAGPHRERRNQLQRGPRHRWAGRLLRWLR